MAPPKKGFLHSVGIVFGKDRHPSKNSGCPLGALLLLAKLAAVVAMVWATVNVYSEDKRFG